MDAQEGFISVLTKLVTSAEPFTDIRLEQDEPVMVRMPSGWTEVEGVFPPSADDLGSVLQTIEADWAAALKKGAINGPINLSSWRLRINGYLAGAGDKVMMSIRRIPQEAPTLKSVGLPSPVRLMLSAPRGLILISGATRSGKSTSAAAMLDAINDSRAAHVITIEDPIEYVFKRKRSVFSQREIGVDTASFDVGLQDAMRQCPDVILVGEIRNRETAETAILAGESGHLVIGTMHANTGIGAVQKLLGWFNDNERNSKVQSLGSSLVGVVHQLLLPRADGTGYALAAEIINNYEQDFSGAIGDVQKMQSVLDRPEKKGSVPLACSLAELANAGTVSKPEAVRAVTGMLTVQEQLRQLLK